MLNDTLNAAEYVDARLNELEDDTDFTLEQHHSERINHHTKMLNYYLNEQRKTK